MRQDQLERIEKEMEAIDAQIDQIENEIEEDRIKLNTVKTEEDQRKIKIEEVQRSRITSSNNGSSSRHEGLLDLDRRVTEVS